MAMPTTPILEADSRSSRLPKAATERFPALDGLRGLAVLLVLLDHASDAELRIFPGADMNRAGKYGVYLFFVLSAFLLTHLLLVRPANELSKARTWLDYFLRRFLRIFPLYAVVLLALAAMNQLKLPQVLSHLLLRDGVKQFWTIPVEVKYYLLVPAVVLAISWFGRREWLRGLLASLGLGALAWGLFAFENRWSLTHTVLLSSNLEPFVFGSLGAIIHSVLSRRSVAPLWAGLIDAVAVGALVVSLVRIPSVYNGLFLPEDPVRKFEFDPLICGLLWTALLIGTLHGRGLLQRLMAWFPLRYLGIISYSAYLWHTKFLRDVDDVPVPFPLRLLLFLLLVTAVSSVSYYLIERPLSKIRPYRQNPGPASERPSAT